jgi:hypothetical protein
LTMSRSRGLRLIVSGILLLSGEETWGWFYPQQAYQSLNKKRAAEAARPVTICVPD